MWLARPITRIHGKIRNRLLSTTRSRLFSRSEALQPIHWSRALLFQAAWTAFLVLPRTYNTETRAYGNLYGNLLDYVVSAALMFYILTIAGVFVLRKRRPDAERPYRAFGYPVVPALYIAGAAVILGLLFVYRSSTTFPGLVIVLIGVPVYLLFRRAGR